MTTLTYTESLVTETCYLCSIRFAMPDKFNEMKHRDKTDFWCPAGHAQHYLGKTHDQQLKEAREAKERAEAEIARAEKAAATAQKKLTNMKKRVNAGVCPHCTRVIKDMAKHIACKHPEVLKP